MIATRSLATLALLSSLAGCYSPSIPDGVQQCAPGGQCAEGYRCGADNRCHKGGGGGGDMATATDGGARDQGAPQDLATPPDLATCKADGDCAATSNPRCDVTSGLCVPCLPQMDNCANGTYCAQVNNSYQCLTGCNLDTDCTQGGQPACCNHRCVDKQSDKGNCGSCGNACAVACCGAACTDTTMGDVANCGMCGNACKGLNATWSCAMSMCAVTSCTGTFGDCNMNAADGCEVNLAGDPNNCTKCGMKCVGGANVNAMGCANGCFIQACNAGFGNCNNVVSDGCEVNLTSNLANCGGCGKPCTIANGAGSCANSTCSVATCNNGFADCDKVVANGCEVNVLTDKNNCGKCGTPCPNGQTCSNGACVVGGLDKVLVLFPDPNPYNGDVQTKLQATGAFAAVDLMGANALPTPTLAQLQAYQVVLVATDGTFADPVGVGNVLAQYWDGGGRVVVATFALGGYSFSGAFATVANGYILVDTSKSYSSGSNETLGQVLEPQSPLMAGVNTFAAGTSYKSSGLPVNGGIVVAKWSGGAPLIVRGVVKGRNRVDLNFFPPSSTARADFWTGDGATILKNALLYK